MTIVLNIVLSLLAAPGSQDSSSLIAVADREFASLNYAGARTTYDALLATSKDSAIVLWKLARACICEADISPRERKIELYQQARGFAERSVRADTRSSSAHAWLAAAIGNVAMFEGGETKVRLCRVIKFHIDKALMLDPNNAVAYSILGSFYKALGDVSWIERQLASMFLGGLPDGGYDESVVAFKKAIEISPEVIRNHYELGKVYLKQEKESDAIVQFQDVLSRPIGVSKDHEIQRSAARLVDELRQRSSQ